MYPKDSFLTKIFDRKMKKMGEIGIYEKAFRSKDNLCKEDFTEVNFGFVKILFIFLAFGSSVSLMIFVSEKLKISLENFLDSAA